MDADRLADFDAACAAASGDFDRRRGRPDAHRDVCTECGEPGGCPYFFGGLCPGCDLVAMSTVRFRGGTEDAALWFAVGMRRPRGPVRVATYRGEELNERWRGFLVEVVLVPVDELPVSRHPVFEILGPDGVTRGVIRWRFWRFRHRGFLEGVWTHRDGERWSPVDVDLQRPNYEAALMEIARGRGRPGRRHGSGTFAPGEFTSAVKTALKIPRVARRPTRETFARYFTHSADETMPVVKNLGQLTRWAKQDGYRDFRDMIRSLLAG